MNEKESVIGPSQISPSSLRPPKVLRLVVGIVGVLSLGLSALVTLGTALAAPLGMFIAGGLAHRRGQPLTRGRSWIAAVVATSVAIVLVFLVVLVRAPDGTIADFAKAAEASRDSVEATTQMDSVTARLVGSRAFTLYFGLVGAVLTCVLIGSLAGTAGWGSIVLLVFALTGNWLPRAKDIVRAEAALD